MDTVGIVYNTDITTRLTTELTSKLGDIRTQQLLSTISDIHYEDCIHQWWTSPATPYTTNTTNTDTSGNASDGYINSSNYTYNYNTSSRYSTRSKTNDTSSSYTNSSYISTSSYISIFDSQQEQQARIHEFISFIRYCTNNNTPTNNNTNATTTTTNTTNTNNYANNNNNTINTNSNSNYTNNTPIIIGHSLFFKLFYSTRLSELLKHTRPELYNMLYNKQYKLINCSVLVLSILFSHDNDCECIILDAEVLYGGGFEMNGGGGIGGIGGKGKRQERLSITSVGSRSRLSGEKSKSQSNEKGSEKGDGRGGWEGGGSGEGEVKGQQAVSSKKEGGLWDSLWGN